MSNIILDREDLVKALTEELYRVDPAKTDCNLNDLFDEYANEASYVADLFVANDLNFKGALFEVLNSSFGNGVCDEELLNEVYRNINERMC